MKILHINELYAPFGGAEEHVLDLLSSLEDMGHDIVVIGSSEKSSIHVQGRQEYLLDNSYGFRSGFRVWRLLRKIIRKENPDIIHMHNIQNFISPFILNKIIISKPSVITVHDTRLFCPGRIWKVIPALDTECNYPVSLSCFKNGCYPFRSDTNNVFWNMHKLLLMFLALRALRKVDRVIVSSDYMREEIVRNGFEKNRITILPLYTNRNVHPAPMNVAGKKKTILYAGRLEETKGILVFIKTLKEISHFDWNAVIIGEGKDRNLAETLAEKLGMGERIAFKGQLEPDKLDEAYRNCYMVVVPSMIPESFGLVGIEAMAFAKPVIAFDSGGIKEWLVDKQTGFIVPRGDVKKLAECIALLLDDEQLGEKMRMMGRERTDRLYRKEGYLKLLLSIYTDLLEHYSR